MTTTSTARLEWPEVWSLVARDVRRRSLCVRDQVGAVITDVTQRIIATGYNGPPQGFPHGDLTCDRWCDRQNNGLLSRAANEAYDNLYPDYSDCPSLHAEANALSVCDRREREGGSLYVTSHICFGCAKLVANSGLANVYVHPAAEHVHRNPLKSYQFLRDCGLEVFIDVNALTESGGGESSAATRDVNTSRSRRRSAAPRR